MYSQDDSTSSLEPCSSSVKFCVPCHGGPSLHEAPLRMVPEAQSSSPEMNAYNQFSLQDRIDVAEMLSAQATKLARPSQKPLRPQMTKAMDKEACH